MQASGNVTWRDSKNVREMDLDILRALVFSKIWLATFLIGGKAQRLETICERGSVWYDFCAFVF
jgi:hypothetical protein